MSGTFDESIYRRPASPAELFGAAWMQDSGTARGAEEAIGRFRQWGLMFNPKAEAGYSPFEDEGLRPFLLENPDAMGLFRDSGSRAESEFIRGRVQRMRDREEFLGVNGAFWTRMAAGMATPEARVQHVLELRPEVCSLDVATMNFGPHAMVNVPRHIEAMARMIRDAGVKPELEVFDLGHVALAAHMIGEGLFEAPPLLQLCLGIPGGAPATTEAMLTMRNALPPGCNWSAFGISRHQFPMVAQAVVLGGQVRVGLEDNLYLSRGVLAPGNAPLVERAARIIQELGAEVATPAQARDILGIPAR